MIDYSVPASAYILNQPRVWKPQEAPKPALEMLHTVNYTDPDGSLHSFELPDITFAARTIFHETVAETLQHYIRQDRLARLVEAASARKEQS